MFHIVLVEPEIPHNAGAAGRLALATGSTLHLSNRSGFPWRTNTCAAPGSITGRT